MATAHRPRIRREELGDGEVLCDHCTAKCCRYFAVQIDTPEDREDYDYLRWFLLHGEATIFTEDGDWYLLVSTECKHLRADGRCGIYATRPDICREYSTESCEFDDDAVYDRCFETSEQMEEYTEALHPRKGRDGLRSPRPPLLPVLG